MGIRVSGVSVACIVGGSVPGVGNLRGCNGNGCSGLVDDWCSNLVDVRCSDRSRCSNSVDIGGSCVNIRGSCDFSVDVGFSCNLDIDVGFSGDIFMNVCLSSDIFVNVRDSGRVNLTSIIVGVDNVVDNRGGGISGNVSVSCRGSGISSMVSGESCIGTSIASIS